MYRSKNPTKAELLSSSITCKKSMNKMTELLQMKSRLLERNLIMDDKVLELIMKQEKHNLPIRWIIDELIYEEIYKFNLTNLAEYYKLSEASAKYIELYYNKRRSEYELNEYMKKNYKDIRI